MTQLSTTAEGRVEPGAAESDGRLTELVRDLEGLISSSGDTWRRQLLDDVVGALRSESSEILAAHGAASDRLTGDFEERGEFRAAVSAYRGLVAEDVVGKMGRFLRSNPPEERAAVALHKLIDSLSEAADVLPQTIEAPSGWDPYRRASYDGWMTRFRKALIRMARAVFRLPAREIPFGLTAAYHLKVRMARRFINLHKEWVRHLCALHASLEELISNWTHATLTLEEKVDDPAFYSPPAFPVEMERDDIDLASLVDQIRMIDADLGSGLSHFVDGLRFDVATDQTDDASLLLETDLRYTGTFVIRSEDRALPSDPYMPQALVDQDLKPWTDWLAASRNRMRINWHLLNLRSVLVGQIESLAERASKQTIEPLSEVMHLLGERLGDIKGRLDDRVGARDEPDLKSTIDGIEAIRGEVETVVSEVTEKVSAFDKVSDFLKGFGDTESESVARAFGQLPGGLRIRVSEATPVAIRLGLAEYVTVDLKSIANRMLGLRYSDQVRRHSDKLKRTVTRRWIDVEQAAEVVRFGLTAAREELEAGEDDENGQIHSKVRQAYELAGEGFTRAIEMSESEDDGLPVSWGEFIHGVAGISLEDWVVLHRQVHGAEMADEWTGYGDRIRRSWKEFGSGVRRLLDVGKRNLEILLRLGRGQAHSLIQRGQSVVGVGQAVDHKRLETIDAVGRWGELMQSLPLVYRRLFSFDPLSDGSHMVNRSGDLNVVKEHFERWQAGRSTNSMLLSSPTGGGRTSFLNVVEQSIFQEADVRHIRLQRRFESEGELVQEIAAELDLAMDGEGTFVRLEEELLGRPKNRRPLVCIVDNIDHVVLRIPGGSRLIEALLIFFSRTDEAVYWISSINTLARHFLEKTLQIGGFIDFYALDPFEKESTQSLLMMRHRKSGLPLKFEEPEEIGTIMKQRLRRAKSETDRQAILSSAFFEKLHRESGQNLRLALFYWLRSIDFEDAGEVLKVRSVRTLNVDFLHELDLRSAFTLKAMLFHSTLTLDEHNRLFRMSVQEGTMILESLLNSGLIVPVGRKGFDVQARVEPDARYRIHPLLVHPITEHLRGRHIVY